MKKKQDRLVITFHQEQDFLHFHANLPKRAKKNMKIFSHWHSLSVFKDEFELLKDRIKSTQTTEEKAVCQIENNLQYKLHETIQSTQVTPWGVAAVKAPEVWAKTEGEGVRVGILDTGIDKNHPDLRTNVHGGINTVDGKSPFLDSNGHGTHVAGTVAALNNQIGVVGVGPKIELFSLKAFSSDGTATLTDIAEAIHGAIDQGIQVINMSFGSSETSFALHKAIRTAFSKGIMMVASAGNSAQALDYPARHTEVLAIGAIDRRGKVASFSNYGKGLDFVMPGVDILSTWPTSPGYNTLSGTSMASPHMTGICALLLATAPNLTPIQLKRILDQSTTKLRNVTTSRQGKGVVLATKAVQALNKQP